MEDTTQDKEEAGIGGLEAAASSLANQNDPESAWYLRGVWDALTGTAPLDEGRLGLYRRQYLAGFDSTQKAWEDGVLS